MNKDISGIYCSRSSQILKGILQNWINVTIDLAKLWKSSNDVPWWDNERANLSVLAGAIWRSGGYVFEEFKEDKRKITKKGKLSRTYSGRVDLYFAIQKYEFIAESKYTREGISLNNSPLPIIERVHASACNDIRKVKPNKQRRLAITFTYPYVMKHDIINLDDKIRNWIKELRHMDCDACAWIFPKISRLNSDGKYVCPGTAILITEI